jgi:uncharacterized lipoprotein YmbA
MTLNMWRAVAWTLVLPLAACSGGDAARYLIDAPVASTSEARVSVRTLELRAVSLPSHASGAEILVQDETGALRALGDVVWADDPERAVTGTLAELLDARSSATVSAEPWPLFDGPSARMDVRITRMLATSAGVFEITGQAAVTAVDGRARDRVERFAIAAPVTEISAAGVTDAQGRALAALADELIGMLR